MDEQAILDELLALLEANGVQIRTEALIQLFLKLWMNRRF